MNAILRTILATLVAPGAVAGAAVITSAPDIDASALTASSAVIQASAANDIVLTSDDDAVTAHTIVVTANDDGETIIRSDGDEYEIEELVRAEAQANMPSVWMGVRLTDVPAPLAAHLGEGGVMIANVVADSPADAAGLERYDIITSLGGQPVNSANELIDVLRDVAPDSALDLGLVRGGVDELRSVTPTQRSDDMSWEWKYDEPEVPLLNRDFKMRGHTLRRGPGGAWIMEDLGELNDLSDVFDDLDEMMIDLGVDLKSLDNMKFYTGNHNWPVPPKTYHQFQWHGGNVDPNSDQQVTITIQRNDDGNELQIRALPDGTIEVDRTDADGNESSAVYDSEGALAEDDPEAFEVFESHAGAGAPPRIFTALPHGDRAKALRQEFQVNVRKHLEEALAETESAREEALKAAQEAREEALQHLRKPQWRKALPVADRPGIPGSGTPATEQRGVKAFRGIELHHFGKVVIDAGAAKPLEITADDNLLPLIRTDVRQGKLIVRCEKRVKPKTEMTIHVGSPDIDLVELGAAGMIDVQNIARPQLSVKLEGAGDVKLAGRTEKLDVELSGAGNVLADDLVADNVRIKLTGAGQANVHAVDRLDAHIPGVGTVNYKGDPKVTKRVTGVGSVTQKR